MRVLELFSGTHSIGKVCKKKGYEVTSLDRDMSAECPFNSGYKSENHFKEDIMTWDYQKYPRGHFDLVTASPVCLWWSLLRNSWIGRKVKAHGDTIMTKEIIENDIEKFGIPMVDKVFEIIDYFNPKFWWIENPSTGKMKKYIPDIIPYYDVDYCKYGMPYKKTTRFWTNIEGFEPKRCNFDCDSIDNKKHREALGHANQPTGKKHKSNITDVGGGGNRQMRYRIPEKLIEELLEQINT
jgi:site-specific DNA-cytosine methylase